MMRRILVAVLFAIFFSAPISSQADQPRVDPEIALLRLRFKEAHPPKIEDLKLGTPWDCKFRSALPGSRMSAIFPGTYEFKLNADGTLSAGNGTSSNPYAFTPSALVGEKTWGAEVIGKEHIRVGDSGELLVEFGLKECKGIECLFVLVRASALDAGRSPLGGYSECRTEE